MAFVPPNRIGLRSSLRLGEAMCHSRERRARVREWIMTIRVKQLISKLLIGTLLFTQLAVAAYACPQLSSALEQGGDAAMATVHMGDMSGCDQMLQDPDSGLDQSNPGLCLEHFRYGQQVTSHAETPSAQPAILVGFITIAPALAPLAPTGRASRVERIAPAASPPLSILHCCFRI